MIQLGAEKYKSKLKLLWKQCFPNDSDKFIEFYFQEIYTDENSLLLLKGNEVVSALQIISYPIKIGSVIYLGGYISGAMTNPSFQKKGYMSELMNASFERMKEMDCAYTFLIPQEYWLFDFYRQFGYKEAFPICENTLPVISETPIISQLIRDRKIRIYDSLEKIDIDDFFIIYSRFLMEQKNVVLKTKQHLKAILWDLFDEKGLLLYNDWGMVFLYPKQEEVIIKEFFFYDSEIKQDFLFFIGQFSSQKKIIYYNNPNAPFLKYNGMIKSLDKTVESVQNIYMSMMLD